jgi:preprotein translocase subunit SecE
VKEYLPLLIWVVVIGSAFAYAWSKGYLKQLGDYITETQEELKKCTWPSSEELKGSTGVVLVSIILLGLVTVSSDFVITLVVRLIT